MSGNADVNAGELVNLVLEDAQRFADVGEVLETALKSFEITARGHAETSANSGNPAFAAVATRARSESKNYIQAVKESVEVVELSVAFAADVVNLCNCLSEGMDEAGIPSFIDGMRTQSQRARTQADATFNKFMDIRRRLLQLRKEILVQHQHIKDGRHGLQDDSKEQDYIGAVELLGKAFDDMCLLVDGATKFANWWHHARSMNSTLETRTLNDQRIHPIRLEMARQSWESIRERYEVYARTIHSLADYYPLDNTSIYASILSRVIAWFKIACGRLIGMLTAVA